MDGETAPQPTSLVTISDVVETVNTKPNPDVLPNGEVNSQESPLSTLPWSHPTVDSDQSQTSADEASPESEASESTPERQEDCSSATSVSDETTEDVKDAPCKGSPEAPASTEDRDFDISHTTLNTVNSVVPQGNEDSPALPPPTMFTVDGGKLQTPADEASPEKDASESTHERQEGCSPSAPTVSEESTRDFKNVPNENIPETARASTEDREVDLKPATLNTVNSVVRQGNEDCPPLSPPIFTVDDGTPLTLADKASPEKDASESTHERQEGCSPSAPTVSEESTGGFKNVPNEIIPETARASTEDREVDLKPATLNTANSVVPQGNEDCPPLSPPIFTVDGGTPLTLADKASPEKDASASNPERHEGCSPSDPTDSEEYTRDFKNVSNENISETAPMSTEDCEVDPNPATLNTVYGVQSQGNENCPSLPPPPIFTVEIHQEPSPVSDVQEKGKDGSSPVIVDMKILQKEESNQNHTPPAAQRCDSTLSTLSDRLDICRICHCEGEENNKLISPCLCSGSLKYVHLACLQKWIKSSDKKDCELCNFDYIMSTKTRPFKEWEKLEVTSNERRKIICSVTFHIIAIVCVIWSLYVLIDRTTEEASSGNLDWPFWTKLIVVAIGFTGGLIFMYVQCKMYFRLCIRWRTFNKLITVENAPEDPQLRAEAAARIKAKNEEQGGEVNPVALQEVDSV